jgi:hypothetical protein
MQGMPPRIYVYIRHSTVKQADGDSVARQREHLVPWAAQLGDPSPTILTDAGISAFHGANATEGELGRFLADVAGKRLAGAYLLIDEFSRFSRDELMQSMGTLINVVGNGVIMGVYGSNKLLISEENAMMGLMLSLVGLGVANKESQDKSNYSKRQWEENHVKAQKGEIFTKQTPSWLSVVDGKWVQLEDKVNLVKKVFDRAVKGITPYAITMEFNQAGIPSVTGKKWSIMCVSRIIKYPAVIGILELKKNRKEVIKTVEGYYPAIIKKEVFQMANMLLKGRKHPAKSPGKRTNSIIEELGYCLCGATLNKWQDARKGKKDVPYTYLRCGSGRQGAKCPYYGAVDYYKVIRMIGFEATLALQETKSVSGLLDLEKSVIDAKYRMEKAYAQYKKTLDDDILAVYTTTKQEHAQAVTEFNRIKLTIESSNNIDLGLLETYAMGNREQIVKAQQALKAIYKKIEFGKSLSITNDIMRNHIGEKAFVLIGTKNDGSKQYIYFDRKYKWYGSNILCHT